MKRSEINQLVRDAEACFTKGGWTLPPNPHWDVTDFGLGDWRAKGLVLVNLAEEPEYCEKLMYAKQGMTTPAHCHGLKKEDIISRSGVLRVWLWPSLPGVSQEDVVVQVNRMKRTVKAGSYVDLASGERITLVPGVYHEFAPVTEEAIIGEVSTANDDATDNHFADPMIGRYPGIEEDEPALVRLVSDQA